MPKTSPRGNAIVLQSGGPTRVINTSLFGVYDEAMMSINSGSVITGLYGSRNGIEGVLNGNIIDLAKEPKTKMEAIKTTPASALGTTRYELWDKEKKQVKEDDVKTAISFLQVNNIKYFFVIGGNDSSETAQIMKQGAEEQDYDLRVLHIPKTVDNDLLETDHCPGYGSAAKFILSSVLGLWFDSRAMGKTIDIYVTIRRDTGWLAASSGLLERVVRDKPLIFVPESPVFIEKFRDVVERRYNGKNLCCVVSEGMCDESGKKWAEILSEKNHFEPREDMIGRKIYSDVPLAFFLAKETGEIKGVRATWNQPNYLGRSFQDCVSKRDSHEAEEVGRSAVQAALQGETGKMVVLKRIGNNPYKSTTTLVPLENVATPGQKRTKNMNMNPGFLENFGVTSAFLDYLEPLVDFHEFQSAMF